MENMENVENTGKNNNVRWRFLAKCATEKTPVTIFLRNGVQIRGTISEFDDEVITVDVNGVEKMVYSTATSTIEPCVRRPAYMETMYRDEARRQFLPD